VSDDAKRPSSRQGKSPPDSAAGSDTPRSNQDTHNSPRATKTPGEISRNFGRYRIIRRLGKGGMGTVFLAEDTQLHREVALKIPHFESDDNQELLERFYREARAAATLNHPNLCPIHDVGEIDGVHYLTMAYIEGQSLSDLVRPGAPLAAENAVAIVHNLALGMAEAHEKGIVHRDLKPSNISMNQRGEPVVMDFGLARRKKSGDARLTKSGAVIGTPAYMPPEQIKGDFDAIGPACDIYSLGVILYELLTGEIPFDGPIAAVLGQVLTQEPPPPSKFRADLDPRLEAVCLKMMAKDISDRHPSMADVARDLALSPQAALEVQPRKAPTPGKRKESAQTKTDSKSTQHTHELDKRKKQIESLLKQCEYAPAIDLLEKMAAIKSPKLAKYSLWAQQQLPKAKRGPEEMRESSAAMQRTAADLYDRHDYEQAAEILQQVPKKYRSPEAKKLLRECLDLQEEIVVLQEDIEQAEAINRFDDLLPTVRRLLEIKPNDRRAKRLLKELKTYGKGGNMRLGGRRDQRFDAVGSTFSPTKAVLFVVIPLLLFGAVSWATVVYIRSNNQTNPTGNPTAKNPVDDSGDGESNFTPASSAEPLTDQGDAGIGKGKHIVFVANEHEYRSEETLPALARILAKHHGFTCTVLFGVDDKGVLKPGNDNVPGLETLETADLMVVFTRFQNWPDEQMQHFENYLKQGAPIVGLRTATHGFKIPPSRKFAKYSDGYGGKEFKDGFGRQILGEKWAGHYGRNHQSSTRLDIVSEQSTHPILRGVKDMWVQCGGYSADPLQPSTVLAMAQPLVGMEQGSAADTNMPPVAGAWTRSYKGASGNDGRVFTTTYGASNDIENEGFRRMLINACCWAVGLEDEIKSDANVSFVGPYHGTWRTGRGRRRAGLKPQDLAGWETPIVPIDE